MINKKMFDKEYQTQMRKEYLYLLEKGFKPTYIYRGNGETIATTYKYTKTPELFTALAYFYDNERNAKTYDNMLECFNAEKRNIPKDVENIVLEILKKMQYICPKDEK